MRGIQVDLEMYLARSRLWRGCAGLAMDSKNVMLRTLVNVTGAVAAAITAHFYGAALLYLSARAGFDAPDPGMVQRQAAGTRSRQRAETPASR